jgi:hypothetical protein
LALEILKAEDQPNMPLIKRLEWIKNNTTSRLRTNYFIIVNILMRKMHYSLEAPIEIRVGRGRTTECSLGEIIAELEESHIKINEIVREVAKRYSIDIPFKTTGFEVPDIESMMKERK